MCVTIDIVITGLTEYSSDSDGATQTGLEPVATGG